MATEETNIVQLVRMETSKLGGRCFRNNRGLFITLDALRFMHQAAELGLSAVKELLKSGRIRKVRAGLEVDGAADLIGWLPVVITPEMVGKKVAVFYAPEVKTDTGRASPEQAKFIQNVTEAGGISGVVRSENCVRLLVSGWMKKMLAPAE